MDKRGGFALEYNESTGQFRVAIVESNGSTYAEYGEWQIVAMNVTDAKLIDFKHIVNALGYKPRLGVIAEMAWKFFR